MARSADKAFARYQRTGDPVELGVVFDATAGRAHHFESNSSFSSNRSEPSPTENSRINGAGS